jgi:MFS superfamily sulfate permease-like transporter
LGRVPGQLIFSDIRRFPENKILPGLLMVRPENGLFFANAAGFREAIMAEMLSSDEPVKAVVLDLGATTDLDAPSADVLAELGEELHRRNVRLMLMRVITPVRQMLERAGAMEKIRPEDIFVGPPEAVLAYLSAQYDDAGIQELIRSGAQTMRSLLQASLASAPGEDHAALAAIVDSLDREIKPIDD